MVSRTTRAGVETGDDTTHPIRHIGNVPFGERGKQTYIKNVLRVPTITKNLVSVGQMVEQGMQKSAHARSSAGHDEREAHAQVLLGRSCEYGRLPDEPVHNIRSARGHAARKILRKEAGLITHPDIRRDRIRVLAGQRLKDKWEGRIGYVGI